MAEKAFSGFYHYLEALSGPSIISQHPMYVLDPLSGYSDAKIKFKILQRRNQDQFGQCPSESPEDDYECHWFTEYTQKKANNIKCIRKNKKCRKSQSYKDAYCWDNGNGSKITEVKVMVNLTVDKRPSDFDCVSSELSAPDHFVITSTHSIAIASL